MIIVRLATGQQVKGWRVTAGHPGIADGYPILMRPDGAVCAAASFLLQGLRATATTSRERTALEKGAICGDCGQIRGEP